MARPKMNEEKKDDLGGFEEEAPAPVPAAKKVAAVQPFVPKGSDGYFEGANKQLAPRPDPVDPAGLKILPERKGGYLNQHGVLFPAGFKFMGGHVGFRGNIVLVKCPKCGHRNPASEAVKGMCSNDKANDGNGCGFSAIDKLEELETV